MKKERMWVNPEFKMFCKKKALELNKAVLDLMPSDIKKKSRGKKVFADLYEEDLKIKW